MLFVVQFDIVAALVKVPDDATPLSQSFAARMQNAGYAAAGLNMAYFYTEADETHPAPTDTGQDKAAQEAIIPENERQTAEQKAPQPDEASGLEIKKGETES